MSGTRNLTGQRIKDIDLKPMNISGRFSKIRHLIIAG